IEVIELVLERTRQESFGRRGETLAVLVERANADLERSLDVGPVPRDRETSFGTGLRLLRALDDLWIDEREQLLLDLDDGDPERDADLRRGETDTGSGAHRIDEIADQRPDLRVDLSHLLRLLADDGIVEAFDHACDHTSILGNRARFLRLAPAGWQVVGRMTRSTTS